MPDDHRRLLKSELSQKFLDGLGDKVKSFSGEKHGPLLVDLVPPPDLKLRVYLFNCTNPPGGRPGDEYKIQIILPGQKRGERGVLDYSEGRMPILAAYVKDGDDDVFVMWDADMHEDFSYSANMQVKYEPILQATVDDIASYTRKNGEVILACRPQYLYDAIRLRIKIQAEDL